MGDNQVERTFYRIPGSLVSEYDRSGNLVGAEEDTVKSEGSRIQQLREAILSTRPPIERTGDGIDEQGTCESEQSDSGGVSLNDSDFSNGFSEEDPEVTPPTTIASNADAETEKELLYQEKETLYQKAIAPPPKADEIDRWQHHIAFEQFGQDLNLAASALFPKTTKSRYRNVFVLMLKWKDEDPNLPVSLEIQRLYDVFKGVYHFETEVWDIPDEDCHVEVNQKILDFSRMGGNSKDDLKIVYYAGHGRLMKNRLLSWTSWRNHGIFQCPTVKWSGIQNVLEEARSDVLLLLDCCHAGTANTNEGQGVTGLISASAYNTIASGVGPYSFTHALVLELESLAHKVSFSTGELYSNIFCRSQLRMPEDEQGTERHPAPIHLVLTNDSQHKRSIQLSKRRLLPPPEKEATQPAVIHNLQTVVNENGEINNSVATTNSVPGEDAESSGEDSRGRPPLGTKIPRLALAIRFHENFRADEMTTLLFTEWLKEFPVIAEQVRVEACFDSFSSLLIISIPIALFAYLPEAQSVIPLGPITSVNRILPQIQSPVLEQECASQFDQISQAPHIELTVQSGVPEANVAPEATSAPTNTPIGPTGSDSQSIRYLPEWDSGSNGSRRSSTSTEKSLGSPWESPVPTVRGIDTWQEHISLQDLGNEVENENEIQKSVANICKQQILESLLTTFVI